MKVETKKVTITLTPAIYKELETVAAKNGHRVSGYIRWLIWKHLEEMDIQTTLFSQEEQ